MRPVEGKNLEEYPAARPINGDAMIPPNTGRPIANQPSSVAISAQMPPEAADTTMILLTLLIKNLSPG
jgi:hypothetical protein